MINGYKLDMVQVYASIVPFINGSLSGLDDVTFIQADAWVPWRVFGMIWCNPSSAETVGSPKGRSRWPTLATHLRLPLRSGLGRQYEQLQSIRMLYFSLVKIKCGLFWWGGTYELNLKSIYIKQNKFIRRFKRLDRMEPPRSLFISLNFVQLQYMFVFKVL